MADWLDEYDQPSLVNGNDWLSEYEAPQKKGFFDSVGGLFSAAGNKAVAGGEQTLSGYMQRAADQKAAMEAYSSNPLAQMGAGLYENYIRTPGLPHLSGYDPNTRGTSETGQSLYEKAQANQRQAQENLQGNSIPYADTASSLVGGVPTMALALGAAPFTMGASIPLVFGAQAYGEDYAQGRNELNLPPSEAETRAKLGEYGAAGLSMLPGAGGLARTMLTGAAQNAGEVLGRGGYDVFNDTKKDYHVSDWLSEMGQAAAIGAATAGLTHGIGTLANRTIGAIKERVSPSIAESIPEVTPTGNESFDAGQSVAAEMATSFALDNQPKFDQHFDQFIKEATLPEFKQSDVGLKPITEAQKDLSGLGYMDTLTPPMGEGLYSAPDTSKLASTAMFPPEQGQRTRTPFMGAPEVAPTPLPEFNYRQKVTNPDLSPIPDKARVSPTEGEVYNPDEIAPRSDVEALQSTINKLRGQSSLRPEIATEGSRIAPNEVLKDLQNNNLGKALSNRVSIVKDVSEIPGDHGLNARSQGAYVDGKLYLVADNLQKGSAVPVALHETVHGILDETASKTGQTGMEALLQKKFPDVVSKIEKLAQSGNKVAISALDRVTKSGTRTEDVPHELASYFAEEAQAARQNGSSLGRAAGVLKDMYSGVKVWAHEKLGKDINLSANDIHYIMRTAAENYSTRAQVYGSSRGPLSSVAPGAASPPVRSEEVANRAVFGKYTLGERLGIRESALKSVLKSEDQSPLVAFARDKLPKVPMAEGLARSISDGLSTVGKAARGLLISDQGKDRLIVSAKDLGTRAAKSLEPGIRAFGNRLRDVTKNTPITEADLSAFEKGGVDAVRPELKDVFKDYHNRNKQNSLTILDELLKDGNKLTKGLVDSASAIAANAGKYFSRQYLLDKQSKYGENLWHDYTKGKGEAQAKAAAIVEPAKQKFAEMYVIPKDLSGKTANDLRDLYQTWVGPLADLRGNVPNKEQMITALDQARANMPKDINDTLNFVTKQFLGLAGKDPSRVADYFRNIRREEGNLRARTHMPEELRKLAGEITDPVTKMTESLATQSHLIGQQKTLNALYDIGTNSGEESFLFKTPGEKPGATVRLAGSSMGPLSGLYTSPLVAEALNAQVRMHNAGGNLIDAISRGEAEKILPAIFGSTIGKGIGTAAKYFRYGHVLLNPKNWIMQSMGAPLHMIRAGNFTFSNVGEGLKATKGTIGGGYRTAENAATNEMLLGGGGDISHAGDLSIGNKKYKNGVNTEFNQSGKQSLGQKFSNLSESYRESFQAGDQVAKEANRLREMDFWKKYYEAKGIDKTHEQLRNEVATRIGQTETAYAKVNLLSKSIDKTGLGYFRGYSEDMSRVMKNNYMTGFADVIKGFQDRNSGSLESGNMLIQHGARRLLGSLVATSAIRGLQVAVGGGLYMSTKQYLSKMFGQDDDKAKKALPEYMQGNATVLGGKDKDGNTLVYDLSPIDPNDPFNKAIFAFASNPTEKGLAKALNGWVQSVTVEPSNLGMYKTVTDFYKHWSTDAPMKSGLEGVAPKTSAGIQARLVNSLGMSPTKANVAISAAEKLLPIKNIAAAWENRNSPAEAAKSGLGIQPVKVNPIKDLGGYDGYSFSQAMSSDKSKLAQYLAIPNVSKDVLANSIKEDLKGQMEAYNKINEKVQGTLALGYTEQQVIQALSEAKVPKQLIDSVINGKFSSGLPMMADKRIEFLKNAFGKELQKANNEEERNQIRANFMQNAKTMNEALNMFIGWNGEKE